MCFSLEATPHSALTMKTFLFINCSNNQKVFVEAKDHDQAIKCLSKELGHFFFMFIKTI